MMTVVLQHRFWDLTVTEERFEVKLTFDSIPEQPVVPFTAIKVFFDPSVPYGLPVRRGRRADGRGARTRSARRAARPPCADAGAGEPTKMPTASEGGRVGKSRGASRRLQSEKSAERPLAPDKTPSKLPAAKSTEPSPAAGPKVVSIDFFRKK